MTIRDRLTVAAVLAVVLACAGLAPVFDGYGWFTRVVGAALVVGCLAGLARALRVPGTAQPLVALAGLSAYVAVVFAGTTLAYGVVPTGQTLALLRDLAETGLLDVQELSPPVPTTPGLVLLAVLGIGVVAVVVDALAVVLRRPAVAGLPLLVLFVVPAAVLPDGVGMLPFVLGAAGWLGLLLVDGSDVVARWGAPTRGERVRRRSDPGLGRVGRRIGVTALGVAVIVPVVVPGLDGSLLPGGSGPGFGNGSRSTTTYNPILDLAGQLSLPEPRELLRYTTDDDTPDYVRLTTLDRFDENGRWSSSELSGDLRDDAVQDGIPTPSGTTRSARRQLTTRVTMTGQLDGPWLPVPFPTEQVQLDGPWLWDTEAETAFSTRTSLLEVDGPYAVSAARLLPSVELLREVQSVPGAIDEVYAEPPTLSPYVRDLLDTTVAGQETDYDRVAALQALFRDPANGFVYDETASTPGLNAPDALENFLVGRTGYCEQYASAMAALVRALGIPARVAVGFTQGTQFRNDSWVVTTNDAHAWPEVWFNGAGWVRFEPTPRSDQIVTTPGYSTAPVELAPDAGPAEVPDAAPVLPDAGAQGPQGLDRADDLATPVDAADERRLSPLLLLVPLALLVLGAPALLAAARRRRVHVDPLTAWAAVCEDAVDVGHAWRPADAPRAAAEHLLARRSLTEPAAQALRHLAGLAEQARYARTCAAGTPDPQAPSLVDDVAAVRAGLMSSVSGRALWQARLLPTSALRRVGDHVSGAAVALLAGVDRLSGAVATRLRRTRTG